MLYHFPTLLGLLSTDVTLYRIQLGEWPNHLSNIVLCMARLTPIPTHSKSCAAPILKPSAAKACSKQIRTDELLTCPVMLWRSSLTYHSLEVMVPSNRNHVAYAGSMRYHKCHGYTISNTCQWLLNPFAWLFLKPLTCTASPLANQEQPFTPSDAENPKP